MLSKPDHSAGNDFSTLYAPLIRDGRMEKFYWAPTREDRVGVCTGIFQHDNVTQQEIEQLVDTFPGQSIDFFGALRARVYDDKVRDFVKNIGIESIGKRLINSKEGKVSSLFQLAVNCMLIMCIVCPAASLSLGSGAGPVIQSAIRPDIVFKNIVFLNYTWKVHVQHIQRIHQHL